ncbi:MAG: DNA gyrase subunit A, partial [Clostridia bacterium]|nr:DNA gyrase subunit A [Clostridia bacterium]
MEQLEMSEVTRIIEQPLEDIMHSSMLPFAEYVILDRALPRVEDGLKPVQRRILYSMMELGLSPDKPTRKCARIVGDCLGKYHPHGDSSVYDALVRLAQPFNMNKPLVEGQGNFGSIDGDSAAAMRYTEAKMSPMALELLRDIDKETVPFSLNFDDTLPEPDMLPGRFPNLLVNGTNGIAIGLATNIPPHNLGEVVDGIVAMIENPKISLDEMMTIIKAPDFPTGGIIVCGEELRTAYETGKGKITIRARVKIEKDGDKKSIVVTEIPYQVNKTALLLKVAEYRETKKDLFADIADIIDESDKQGLRVVFKLKRGADANRMISTLMKQTDLSKTFGINMVAIAGGKPKLMGILEIMSYYIEYQRTIIL